jgi:hypothetical protein
VSIVATAMRLIRTFRSVRWRDIVGQRQRV